MNHSIHTDIQHMGIRFWSYWGEGKRLFYVWDRIPYVDKPVLLPLPPNAEMKLKVCVTLCLANFSLSIIPPEGENPSTGTNVYPITWHLSAVLLQTKRFRNTLYNYSIIFYSQVYLTRQLALICWLWTSGNRPGLFPKYWDHRLESSYPTHLIQQQPSLTYLCGNAWPWCAFQVEKTTFRSQFSPSNI